MKPILTILLIAGACIAQELPPMPPVDTNNVSTNVAPDPWREALVVDFPTLCTAVKTNVCEHGIKHIVVCNTPHQYRFVLSATNQPEVELTIPFATSTNLNEAWQDGEAKVRAPVNDDQRFYKMGGGQMKIAPVTNKPAAYIDLNGEGN